MLYLAVPRLRVHLAFALLLLPALAWGEAGVYLEEEVVKTQGQEAPRVSVSRTWLVPGKLHKADEAGGTTTIVRDDKKALWVLNVAGKTWFEIDRESFEQMGRMGMAALMQGGDADAASWFVRSGREKRVGEWKAYEVLAENKPVPGTRFSIWLSREVAIDPKLRESAQMAFGAANPGARFLEALRQMEGYPVEILLTLRAGAAVLSVRQTLKKLEQQDIPEERFQIPEGFTRTDSPFSQLLRAAETPTATPSGPSPTPFAPSPTPGAGKRPAPAASGAPSPPRIQ